MITILKFLIDLIILEKQVSSVTTKELDAAKKTQHSQVFSLAYQCHTLQLPNVQHKSTGLLMSTLRKYSVSKFKEAVVAHQARCNTQLCYAIMPVVIYETSFIHSM